MSTVISAKCQLLGEIIIKVFLSKGYKAVKTSYPIETGKNVFC